MKYVKILPLILLIPNFVFADAGTGLIWVTFSHLSIGNLIIGIIEGIILSFILKSHIIKTILRMVLANYLSAAVGVAITIVVSKIGLNVWSPPFKISMIIPMTIILFILFIVLTVFIEWPFVFLTQQKDNRNWKYSFKISSILQLITGIPLIFIYISVSGFGLATQLKYNKFLMNELKSDYIFIVCSQTELNIKQVSLKQGIQKTFSIDSFSPKGKLFLSTCISDTASICLYSSNRPNPPEIVKTKIMTKNEFTPFLNKTINPMNVLRQQGEIEEYYSADFRDTTERNWLLYSWGWAIEGLRINDKDNNELRHYELESPFAMFYPQNPSILGNEHILVELQGQIILINWKKNEYCTIMKGENLFVLKMEDGPSWP